MYRVTGHCSDCSHIAPRGDGVTLCEWASGQQGGKQGGKSVDNKGEGR